MLPAKPCLPTSAPCPPVGPEWLHQIKHDGYRMLAHHEGARVRLISPRGLDWLALSDDRRRRRGPCGALLHHRRRTDRLRCERARELPFAWRKRDAPAIYCAFGLLQRDGRDLRGEPIETRKDELARLLTGCQPLALVLNRVYDDPGLVFFEHACKLGREAIVSKRRGSRSRTSRDRHRLIIRQAAGMLRMAIWRELL
jgi:bifunctional non-homologous end joining protein LigD